MGMLSSFLFPVGAVTWIARQVRDAAEQQLYDERLILTALKELNEEYESGQIDDLTFHEREDQLLDRLEIAQLRSRGEL